MNPLSALDSTFLAMNLSLDEVLRAMLLSFGLGVAIAVLYHLSVPGRVVQPMVQRSLVLLAMIGAMIMMVIGNNLARAFSLVGALSIVRFRTQLGSAWDISFVFLALAAGIGCGVFAWQVSLIGTGVVALAVLALHVLPIGGVNGEVHLLRCDVAAYKGTEGAIAEVLDRHLSRRSLEEALSQRFGEAMSYRYRVVVAKGHRVEDLLRELSQIEGVERVVLAAGERPFDGDD